MPPELALLNNLLTVGAVLFGVGLVGFLSRRNMIVMFLSVEIMLQGVSLSLVAWGRFHNDFGGQMLVLFIVAVAACEAAVALALVLTLFRRQDSLDVLGWRLLGEFEWRPMPELAIPEESEALPTALPRLATAGAAPFVPPEETEHRPEV